MQNKTQKNISNRIKRIFLLPLIVPEECYKFSNQCLIESLYHNLRDFQQIFWGRNEIFLSFSSSAKIIFPFRLQAKLSKDLQTFNTYFPNSVKNVLKYPLSLRVYPLFSLFSRVHCETIGNKYN